MKRLLGDVVKYWSDIGKKEETTTCEEGMKIIQKIRGKNYKVENAKGKEMS